ncbi:MAG: tetratricopeptide repeat protein [Abitibacteriaceae bacterium]|nr:tetratricopeptide repeat protein [Abditibacteriaceae bacterium]
MKASSLSPATPRLSLLLRILAVATLLCIAVNLSYLWWKHQYNSTALDNRLTPTLTAQAGDSSSNPSPAVSQAQQQEQWLLFHPDDVQARLQLARFYFLDQQFPDAIHHLVLAKSQRPHDAQLLLRLSMAYKENDQPEEALATIQQATKIAPKNINIQEWLGEVYLAQGRSEEALLQFDHCLKQDPKAYGAWMGKGRSIEQLYLAKQGVATLDIVKPVEQAVKIQPDNVQGLTILARMKFSYLAQLEESEKLARRAQELDPNQVEPYILLAQIYLKSPTPAHLDEAESVAQKAAQLDQAHPGPFYTLARVQMQKGKIREAITSLEQSIKIKPLPEAIYMLSQAYARTGDSAKARQYNAVYREWNDFMEKRKVLIGAFQRNPQDISVYCRLAELYRAKGSYEPAENWLRKAQQLQPHNPQVLQLLNQVEKQKQQSAGRPAATTP